MTDEVVSHVGGVVHTEAHGDDEVDAGDHVNCQPPEVDEPSNIDLNIHGCRIFQCRIKKCDAQCWLLASKL